MNPDDVLILVLATWRLSSLIVEERGPFDIFLLTREASGITHDDNGKILTIPDRFFPSLLSCVWCTSVWVGTGITIAYLFLGVIAVWLLFPLALSAGAILLSKL